MKPDGHFANRTVTPEEMENGIHLKAQMPPARYSDDLTELEHARNALHGLDKVFTELRAARRVVEAVRAELSIETRPAVLQALAAYDAARGGADG